MKGHNASLCIYVYIHNILLFRDMSISEIMQAEQMIPGGQQYTTRLHLVLRNTWPAARLLDLLVRLHPETGKLGIALMEAFCQKRMNLSDFVKASFPEYQNGVCTE